MGNEQSGHHKNGAEKLKKNEKNKEVKPEETSGESDVVKQDLDTKEPDATTPDASVGLASVLQVPTDISSEISTAETVTNNQVQNEIPVEKEISVDTKTVSHEHKAEQPKPVELTKTETFFYECKQEEPSAAIIDVIPESSLAVEKPIAKAEPSVVVEKPVAKADTNVTVEKPIAKTEPSVVNEKPIAKTEDSSKDLEKPVPLQSLLDLEGNTSQRIGESSRTVDSTIGQSGRTPLLNQETLEPQKKLTELERVSTETLNAPLLTTSKDDGSESPRKEIVEKEKLKRNKSFLSSFLCCTVPQ